MCSSGISQRWGYNASLFLDILSIDITKGISANTKPQVLLKDNWRHVKAFALCYNLSYRYYLAK